MKMPRTLQALGGLLLALAAGLTAPAASAATGYYTQSGKIYEPGGQEVQLRGISHYGFNADILQPQFLWSMGWKEQIAQIKALGFNAVRVPFVPDTLYVTTKVDELSYVDASKNPELMGKTPLQVLDLWMVEAERQGLYVLLDFHSVSKIRQYPTWFVSNSADYGLLWNRQAYPADFWRRDLVFVAQRYAHLSRFIGIDLYNEPNGVVRWSTGDPNASNPAHFWKAAAESAAAAVLQANPRLLVFVQGINGNYDGIEDSSVPMNWGEDFQPQAYQPLNIPTDKLVLTPHTYGPDVFMKSSFGAPNYPANLAADWEKLFGKFAAQHPVVVGEWGGRFGQGGNGWSDVQWQNAFVDYLLSKGIRSSFYWCYTPNSGDTGGILDDNLNVREDKMALLRRHWGGAGATTPTPSALALSAGSYAVSQSGGALTVSITRTGSTGAINVQYATADGTAKAGSDYTAVLGTWAWGNGDTSTKTFTVPISNATPFSGTRAFTIRLMNPSTGAVLGSPSTATATINGSAAAAAGGTLALSATGYTVAQDAGRVTIRVNRASGASGAVSVRYTTADGTAKYGSDYSATGGTLYWAAGDTAPKSFSVAVSNAVPRTGSRSFSVSLALAKGGAVLGTPRRATVTITGSKAAPATVAPYIMSFSPTSGPVGTVVTINGSGFTGVNAAWAGQAHDAPVSVVSDSQVRVTIPAGATTGAIGIFNAAGASFTPSSFTVR